MPQWSAVGEMGEMKQMVGEQKIASAQSPRPALESLCRSGFSSGGARVGRLAMKGQRLFLAIAWGGLFAAAGASAAPDGAAVVRATYEMAMRNDSAALAAARTIDFHTIASFVLSAAKSAQVTPHERAAMESAVRDIVHRRLQSRARAENEILQVISSAPLAGDQMGVVTVVGNRRVTWRLRLDGPEPLIVDVAVNGASLRAALRDDFIACLARVDGSVAGAIQALREQYARRLP